jgi:hypothetical protein
MVGKVDADMKEGLEERDQRAFKTLSNKKGDAITACFFEGV